MAKTSREEALCLPERGLHARRIREEVSIRLRIAGAGSTETEKACARMSDVEAATDFAAVLARVRAGSDVVIEHGSTPVAVVHPARPARRAIEECIALLPEDLSGTVDVDFADDVTAAVASHPESLNPPPWD